MSTPVTLLTDYGPGTEHVGALHAVIARACPDAARIDLAHDIPPGDVRFGAIVLARTAAFTAPAVHLAVVDPGVGSGRRGVAVRCEGGRFLVGPDNGLLALACEGFGAVAAVVLSSAAHHRTPVAPTFHGRDVFAPAAAHLAGGGDLAALGEATAPGSLAGIDLPAPETREGRLAAAVAGVDRFGNCELLAGAGDLAHAFPPGAAVVATVGARELACTVAETFAGVASGAGLVHVDGSGRVAVAVRDASAAARLGASAWDRIVLVGVDSPDVSG